MNTNARTLLAAIVAVVCFLPFSEGVAETLVYKGTITVVGEQTQENFTDVESPTKKKIRKKIRVIFILNTTGPQKALIYIDPKAKIFNFDVSNLTKFPVSFFGVNGKPSIKSSVQNYVSNNFSRDVDRDGAAGDDTNTTKAGSLRGNLRLFDVGETPVFAAKTLRGKYVTTRYSEVVTSPTSASGYDPGSEFATFEERMTLRINKKQSREHISNTVSDTFAETVLGLIIDDGLTEDATVFADGFESGDTAAWTSGAP